MATITFLGNFPLFFPHFLTLMARFIIISLLVVVAVIFSITFILGALRRLFSGNVSQSQQSKPSSPKDKILYQNDEIVVLKGSAKDHERRVE